MNTVSCAVCNSRDYRVRYSECLDYSKIDFSPRRTPLRNHCRIVQCAKCGLVYASPIFSEEKILDLYKNSRFENEIQVELMADDYLDRLKDAGRFVSKEGNILEIGCGNGCFLKKAKDFGFQNVYGVEPGKDAVVQADPSVRGSIVNDVFKGGIYEYDFFDLVCVIQVFDHLTDPNDVLDNISRVLKKGGFILVVSHNVRFFLTKIFGEKSPMYDIEHIYLFDKITIKKMLEKHGFEVIYVKDVFSRYTLGHIVKFFPFPASIKRFLWGILENLKIGDKAVKLMGGNMVALARKIA